MVLAACQEMNMLSHGLDSSLEFDIRFYLWCVSCKAWRGNVLRWEARENAACVGAKLSRFQGFRFIRIVPRKSLRHFFHTREVGLQWTPLVRDIFDSVAGAVVSISCLFSIWAFALFSTKCCVHGGMQWPFGAQVLLAAIDAALIGIAAGLEFGHNLQSHAELKSGTMALVMSNAVLWQILSVTFGLVGMILVAQVVPIWQPRVPIDAEVSLLAEEFGPASFLRVVLAATSAPVASVFGRMRLVLFPDAAPDDGTDVDESELTRFQTYC